MAFFNKELCSILLLLCFGTLVTCWQVFPDSTVQDYDEKCGDALSTNITACINAVHGLGSNNFYSQPGLELICTDKCQKALQQYEQTVIAGCPGVTYTSEWGNEFPISSIASMLAFNFNQTCLKDEGQYCNIILGNLTKNGGDECHKCTLLKLRNEAQFLHGSGPKIYSSVYPSFTSSCGFTEYPLMVTPTSIPPSNRVSSSVAATPTDGMCRGTKYTIKKGDTCNSISKSQSMATMQLLLDNHLQAYCHNFPKEGDLCIENQCTIYTVQKGDTCKSVAEAHNITSVQLRSYNPWIDGGCYNFNRTIGTQICVDEPGTKYHPPSGPSGGTSTTTVLPVTSAVPAPTSVANGTTTQCGKYYTIQDGEDCSNIVEKFIISRQDFGILNPGVNANCTNLLSGVSYCVKPVGSIDNYPGAPGNVPAYSTIPWDNLPDATYAPIIAPSVLPIARGTTEDCLIYVDGGDLQYDFGVSQCEAAEFFWGVPEGELLQWNPSLQTGKNGTSCSFNKNYQYCLQKRTGSSTPSTESGPTPSPTLTLPATSSLPPSTGPSTDATTGAVPSPTQANSISRNCNAYEKAVKGDNCVDFSKAHGITENQLYAWNSILGEDGKKCDTLFQGNTYYCVGVETPDHVYKEGQVAINCDVYHRASQSETCESFAKAVGISMKSLYEWNGGLGAGGENCGNALNKGDWFCVGINE